LSGTKVILRTYVSPSADGWFSRVTDPRGARGHETFSRFADGIEPRKVLGGGGGQIGRPKGARRARTA